MSILIPGMGTPTSCRKCKLKMNCDNCEGWECYCLPLGKNIGYMDDEPEIPSEKRRDNCPLIHVPPYGRLIDAAELQRDIHEHDYVLVDKWNSKDKGMFTSGIDYAISIAPTIIPTNERPTNADRLRQMTDEELAERLANFETRCYLRLNPLADCNTKNFTKQILGWLKSPVKQEVNNG